MHRRQFLGSLPLAAAGAGGLRAEELPKAPEVTNPRATSGDPVEPHWESGVTVTVGPQKADLAGSDHRVIQAAVDYVARLGGGTVRILPGTYRFRNAVYLQSRVRIMGSGADSVLIKEPSVKTKLAVGELELDLLTRTATRDGQAIDLQPREFRLLEYLMRHAGQVVTRTMLLESVWEYHFDPQTNVIDVHISRLRAKIDKGFTTPLLHTIRGAGYMIRAAK